MFCAFVPFVAKLPLVSTTPDTGVDHDYTTPSGHRSDTRLRIIHARPDKRSIAIAVTRAEAGYEPRAESTRDHRDGKKTLGSLEEQRHEGIPRQSLC